MIRTRLRFPAAAVAARRRARKRRQRASTSTADTNAAEVGLTGKPPLVSSLWAARATAGREIKPALAALAANGARLMRARRACDRGRARSRGAAGRRSRGRTGTARSPGVGDRSRRACTVLSTLLCLRRHGPRNRRSSRGPRSSEGRRQARLHLEGLRARRGDNSRRPRGNDRGRPRNHKRWLVAGRRRPDRRYLSAGQQQQRIQVPVRLRGPPHAEVDVGHGQLDHPARADRPDEAALRDSRPAPNDDRAEMQQRDRVTVLRLERDRSAPHRDGAGEGDDPGRGASTGVPAGAPMSIPRCWPAAYGSSPSRKGRRTGPCTGQAQPRADAGTASAAVIAAQTSSRTVTGHLFPLSDMETTPKVAGPSRSLSNLITTRCGRADCALLR